MPLKKLSLTFLSICLFILAKSQSWTPVGNGLDYGGYVNALYVHDSVLYAGGVFTSPGNNIAQWNGSSWDSLTSGINGEVFSLGYYQNKLYAGGWFTRAGGYSAGSIAAWNGRNFSNAGFDVEGGTVNALQVYDSLLYVGGSFDTTNHTQLISKNLISWDGTRVDSVGFYGTTNYFYNGQVLSLITYEGPLFIGNNAGYLLYWNNYAIGFCTESYHINCMCVCNDTLYVGMDNGVCEYDKASKQLSYIGGTGSPVYALTSYKNLLFAGGSFDTVSERVGNTVQKIAAHNVAMWKNGQWSALGNGLNGPVYSLAVFDNNLYAGGYFTLPGNGIAEFAGPLGVAELKNTYSATIYPNPGNGEFTLEIKSSGQLPAHPQLKIYNILGSIVYSSEITTSTYHFNMTGLSQGAYFYSLSTPDGNLLSAGKLVIE